MTKHINELEKAVGDILPYLTSEDIESLRQHLPEPIYKLIYKLVKRPCADGVVIDDDRRVLLVKREKPFECWNIPGGVVRHGETAQQTVLRRVYEETGIEAEIDRTYRHNAILGEYSRPDIDRIWTRNGSRNFEPVPNAEDIYTASMAVAYLARPRGGELNGKSAFFDFLEMPDTIGFHHRQVLEDAERLIR